MDTFVSTSHSQCFKSYAMVMFGTSSFWYPRNPLYYLGGNRGQFHIFVEQACRIRIVILLYFNETFVVIVWNGELSRLRPALFLTRWTMPGETMWRKDWSCSLSWWATRRSCWYLCARWRDTNSSRWGTGSMWPPLSLWHCRPRWSMPPSKSGLKPRAFSRSWGHKIWTSSILISL